MARFDDVFNVDDLPEVDYSPLPAGEYTVEIKSAELKQTKSGTGQLLNVGYQVIGETQTGRMIFGNLNVRNANPKAEEIGRQQMGSLMRACGLAKLQDTDQLIGCNLKVKVTIRKSDEYGEQNEVKGWKALHGSVPSSPKKETAPWSAPTDGTPF
jgi:hypothetical protein